MQRWAWIAAVLVVLAPLPARAQQMVVPGGELEEYYRLLELNGGVAGMPLIFRTASSLHGISVTDTVGPWHARLGPANPDAPAGSRPPLGLLPVEIHAVFNSGYASGINDGALWAGRGISGAVSAGGTLQLGPLNAILYPTFWSTQNRAFPLAPVTDSLLSPFGYPWQSYLIDWPQRFGDQAFAKADWGQTDIRFAASWFTAGISSENAVWGPAFRNPIILSATAEGFPHVDLGTGRAARTPLGRVESRLVWGRLTESAYFDTVSTNNARLFTGFTLALEPRWLPGLTLGLTRVLYMPWDDSLHFVDFVDVFQPFFKNQIATSTNPEGTDNRDQLLSLIARWVLPESGFEAYVEWARNDHSRNLRDFLIEPDHSQAWTAGFQKAMVGSGTRSRLRGEWTHLGRPSTFQVRADPTYYVHFLVRQGYTERGQLLGAGIGPGSDSQHLGFDRYLSSGRWGVFIQRVRYDDDAYYTLFGPTRYREGHQIELTGGLSLMRRVGKIDVTGAMALSRELNRYYVVENDVTNINLQFALRWNP
ncbi:MAG: hypothetical protein HY700_03045 [Gemmatimonadetes bacterium]|nr:hypothetical protein [Gemmatimonadota bacterium]